MQWQTSGEACETRFKPEAQSSGGCCLIRWLALKAPTIWTTIGHGGGGKVRGAQLKAMGVMPGWPDILVIHPAAVDSSGVCWAAPTVVGIELKSKKGKLSAEQRKVFSMFAQAGCACDLARSLNDVATILINRGVPLKARPT